MLLLHGFGCDQHVWRHLTPAFEDDFRIVSLDLMGAGGSDLSAYDAAKYASLEGHASDVLDVVRELDLRDVVLVGHSVSAMIAVLVAIEEPERFDKLVLVTPSPRYIDDPPYVGGFTADDIEDMLRSLNSNYLGWSAAMAPVIMGNPERPALGEHLTESICRMDPEMARQVARVTFMSDSRADLPRVTVPTLVLQCSQDVVAPVEVGAFVRDAIPGATMVMLDATGHCPHLSAPRQTNEAISDFVRADQPALR